MALDIDRFGGDLFIPRICWKGGRVPARTQPVGSYFFFGGMLLLIVTIAASVLKRQPGRREVWAALGIAAVYLLAWTNIETPEERTHLIEYSVVALLIFQALAERQHNGRRVPSPALLAVSVTALLGWIDEGIQYLLPDRVYALLDVGFNALAGLMAILASLALKWAQIRWRGLGKS